MGIPFSITSTNGNSVSFTSAEACDTGQVQFYYGINRGAEESAGGSIKQQIRPGKRFNKTYEMNLTESKYIDFINMLTDQSDDYYITFTTVPNLLLNDSSMSTTNNFKISILPDTPSITVGDPIIYKFIVKIQSVNLL